MKSKNQKNHVIFMLILFFLIILVIIIACNSTKINKQVKKTEIQDESVYELSNINLPFRIDTGELIFQIRQYLASDNKKIDLPYGIFLAYSLNKRDQQSIFGNGWTHPSQYETNADIKTGTVAAGNRSHDVSGANSFQKPYNIKSGNILPTNIAMTLETRPTAYSSQSYNQMVYYANWETQIDLKDSGHYEEKKVNILKDDFGQQFAFTYNDSGYVGSVTDPGGYIWNYKYSRNGNLIEEEGPPGNMQKFKYNNQGYLIQAVTSSSKGNFKFDFSFDNAGRVSSYTENGIKRSVAYFPQKSKTVISDPAGKSFIYFYNARGQITGITHPDGIPQKWEYENDRMVSHTMRDGSRFTYEYDDAGRLTRETNPSGSTSNTEYLAGSNLVSRRIAPNGLVTRYEYNSDNRRGRIGGCKGYNVRVQ